MKPILYYTSNSKFYIKPQKVQSIIITICDNKKIEAFGYNIQQNISFQGNSNF